MKKLLMGLAAAGFLLSTQTSADETLYQAIDADYEYLEDLYLYLHQNPEISFQEADTMARVAGELRGLGFDVTENVGGYGLVGVLENGEGPTVLVRTDLDALPVRELTGLDYASLAKTIDDRGAEVFVMHACGHDVHMTSFVGTARQLAALKSEWQGTVVMIGQPAEERVGGAQAMLADGLFERFPKPDYNLAFHTSASLKAGDIGYVPGYALANVDSVDIIVHGIGGHGAYPHTTKDPVVLASQIVMSLQTLVSRETSPLEPGVVTVGYFHGGTKRNIISDEVVLQLTVRSYSDEVRQNLLDGIVRIAENAGRMAGLPEDLLPDVDIIEEEHAPSVYNNPELVDRVIGALREAGVSNSIEELSPVMGAEDFSHYGRTEDRIPSFMFWIGGVEHDKFAAAEASGEALPSLHSPFFAPDPELTITMGVRAMTVAVLELLGKK